MSRTPTDKVVLVQELLFKGKKAKINWVMAVTGSTFEDLQSIALEQGFIIRGEYIALSSESGKILKESTYKPIDITIREIPQANKYCPFCGLVIEKTETGELIHNFCVNCGNYIKEIFEEKFQKEYFKKSCLKCGALNCIKAVYCMNCAFRRFKRIV